MNKIYDKLLLALAVLLLLAGVGFYVMKSGDMPASKSSVSTEPAANPYDAVPVPRSDDIPARWPESRVQEPHGWRYDVFTPPKIYIGEDGRFTIVPWKVEDGTKEEVPPPPFGIYLASVSRDPYRIQLEGYIEEDREDATKSLVLFYDEENRRSIRARVGDEKPTSEFKLLEFEVERIRVSGSNIRREARATILDQRTGEEIVLVEGERRLEDTMTVIIRSDEHPSFEAKLTEAGQSFETPSGQYILEEINLEESSVTVKKLGDASLELEPETKTLVARSAKPQSNSPGTADKTEDESSDESNPNDETLEFLF